MRMSKQCPKCMERKIIRVLGRVGPYFDGNNIPIGVTKTNAVLVTRYICSSCGYTEEWIDDKASLKRLEENFPIYQEENLIIHQEENLASKQEVNFPTYLEEEVPSPKKSRGELWKVFRKARKNVE